MSCSATVTRHLLLMTATPHSGKEEDFQLFLTLLDRDRFEGKQTRTRRRRSGIMRRMVKEDLLTFEGKKLFPERIAETVPYELTDARVRPLRGGHPLRPRGDEPRRPSSAASARTPSGSPSPSCSDDSPPARRRSTGALVRRSERLERKRARRSATAPTVEPELGDRHLGRRSTTTSSTPRRSRRWRRSCSTPATAAQTVEELNAELIELADLDRWSRDASATPAPTASGPSCRPSSRTTRSSTGAIGWPRKLIIFTEHRDTLDYLTAGSGSLLGKPDAVKAIHGGVRRSERRQITEEFTKNRDCQILLATDAAGEGLNLQAAHLMVNYDLPWNPNRIEQRFGRIHRIGQSEVCRLWNLVASNTREGEVFTRLLEKIDEQREAYGGKVFDVLGEAFTETPLRDLLMEAIRTASGPR